MSGARRLGRYVVGERLGSGGLGEVYLAHLDGASGFRKRVVVKQVRRELAARPGVASLLRAEAEVVQRLAHGNIVQVLDFGVDEGQPYLVMEEVDGVSLARLLGDPAARAGLDVAAALFIVESVCAALDHAHAADVVHRDVTPANILVSRTGVVKLTDFGIASLVATAADAGTPGYAAPEQLAGQPVDVRADVHALGVVLRKLLAWPGADPELHAIAARASAPDRDARHPTAHALAAALETWRAARSILHAAPALAVAVRDLQDRQGRAAGSVDAALEQRRRVPVTAALPPPRRRRLWLPLVAVAVTLAAFAWTIAADPPAPAVDPAPAPPLAARPAPAPLPAPERPPDREPDPPPAAIVAPAAPPAPPQKPKPRDPVAARGRLLVNLVPWAEASVDGRPLGRTPIAVDLPAGRHELVLVNPELGQRRARQVAIAGGADTHITDW